MATLSTESKSMFHVVSPVNNEVYLTRAYATTQELREVLRQARAAFPVWKGTPLEARCRIVLESLKYFRAHEQELAQELTWMIGRPVQSAPREIQGYIARCEYLAMIAPQALATQDIVETRGHHIRSDTEQPGVFDTSTFPYCIDRDNSAPKVLKRIIKEPLGIIVTLAAWNYPYLIAGKSIIPAILAGNVVIIRPSSQAPTVAERILQAFLNAGMPKGVLQYIHASDSSTETLIRHKLVSHVQYNGSVEGGRAILAYINDRFIDTTMELGGCDSALVRPDADLDMAAVELVDGAFFNSGQCCCGVQRIYAHASIYDRFVRLFLDQTFKQYGNFGDPTLPTTTLGPCIKVSSADALRDLVLEDISNGAVSLLSHDPQWKEWMPDYQARLDTRNSPYVPPVILGQTTPHMNVNKEELFGPIVSLTKVASDEEAISLMNNNQFGLTASIWTKDTDLVLNLFGPELQVGTVYQNKCDMLDPTLPWTATKNSGKGTTMSSLGFDQITRPKSFYLRQTHDL